MLTSHPTIYLVAGDPVIRRGLARRLKEMRLTVAVCGSAEDLLETRTADRPGCVLLGVGRSDADLELLKRLGPREKHLPVIVVATQPDVPLAVRVMKLGAFDFLDADCPDAALIHAIEDGICWSEENRRRLARIESIRRRMARLKPGQREVLDLLVTGKSNAEIAEHLELSVRAIEERRAKVMETMRARSLAELVRLAVAGM
jgi:two-component system, LuxR family, response regulator FixJ